MLGVGRAEPAHRLGQDLAVAARAVGLKLRLELVVAGELVVGVVVAEHARELAANAAVPVDQRPVAVEGRPALHVGELSHATAHFETVIGTVREDCP